MQEAVDATRNTLEARGRLYRNLVVAVVAVVTIAAATSLLLWTPRPLAILASLIPLCGAFLLLDGRLMLRWQRAVLAALQSDGVRLSVLKGLLRAQRHLPERSLLGMLAALPEDDPREGGGVAGVEAVLREARMQQRRTLLGAAMVTLLVGVPAGASLMTPIPLVVCLAGILAVLVGLSRS